MSKRVPVAIVGIGATVPGSTDVDGFWQTIEDARDETREVPSGRWVFDASPTHRNGTPEPDRVRSRRGGFVHNDSVLAQIQDASLKIDPAFVAGLDPLCHMTLAAGQQAWASARTYRTDPRRIGVIMANLALPTQTSCRLAEKILGDSYTRRLFHEARLPIPDSLGIAEMPSRGSVDPGTAPINRWVTGLPAGVLARALGIGGNHYTLDAACSSSLFALWLAMQELWAGRADAMLTGGCNGSDSLYTQMGFSQLRALSPTGVCSPFDERGDGLVVGEGAAFFVLKRLADAIEHGDCIFAVIRGVGISNDVGGNLLSPRSEGQLRAMADAYEGTGLRPSDLDLVECHATGTPVGDATEYESLREFWRRDGADLEQRQAGGSDRRCVIGSVKANVGHLLTGAGAAGLLKTVLSIDRKRLPPQPNFHSPAAGIDAGDAGAVFRILSESQPWTTLEGRPRRAAVSGFGFGGTNAHVVLESFDREDPSPSVTLAVPVKSEAAQTNDPVAIVGLGAHVGPYTSLNSLRSVLMDEESPRPPRFKEHFYGIDSPPSGWFIDQLEIYAGRFRVPPSELQKALPQQILALQVAAAAIADAGASGSCDPLRTGVFFGIGLDHTNTGYHLRWQLRATASQWGSDAGLSGEELDQWVEALCEGVGPALDADRTVGGLGSISASRVAREFGFGGPAFVVSNEDNSGLAALEAATRAIESGTIDMAIVGAVDLAADPRIVWATEHFRPGCKLGEGACALVVKRESDARADGNRIYALLRGIGSATGGEVTDTVPTVDACSRAMEAAGTDADIALSEVDYVVAHQSGDHAEDACENRALAAHYAHATITHAKQLGHCGAASALVSVVKACLDLHHRKAGLRAAVSALSVTGNCAHAIFEAGDLTTGVIDHAAEKVDPMRKVLTVQVGRDALIPPPLPVDRKSAQPIQQPPSTLPAAAGNNTAESSIATLGEQNMRMIEATASAHRAFLEYSQATQALLSQCVSDELTRLEAGEAPTQISTQAVFLNREQCLEFAVGKIGRVLGESFAEADKNPTRVRLPDEPLMLVDRVLSIEGEPRSMTHGRVVTEHDVTADKWYLDGNRIPTCIAVEAGQADLLLSAYLGIDEQTRGEAMYRLLDAQVTFHDDLVEVGKTIHYDIHIERFFRHGDTWLFRFGFEATVEGRPLMTMADGCAGFFTQAELAAGVGIIDAPEGDKPVQFPMGATPYRALAPEINAASLSMDEAAVDALRAGDVEAAFGPRFAKLGINLPATIPGQRMRLVHRVTELKVDGGPAGLGMIIAEADIFPDDWFLTCHFVDDKVMPGTLMYECCMHTLRILLLRKGWIGEVGQVFSQPIPGVQSGLCCRGQVLESTKVVTYEITVKSIAYIPEPAVIVDALMYADGKAIVKISDMSLRMTGLDQKFLESLWSGGQSQSDSVGPGPLPALYDRDRILEYCEGKPSKAFGEPYRIFDSGRKLARLPRPPYLFMDRVVAVEGTPFEMAAGSACQAQVAVAEDSWYFASNRQAEMPTAILLEIALQPCGWLAAYVGSALAAAGDVRFRNLGGSATLHHPIRAEADLLTTSVKMTKVSNSGGVIIQNFEMEVASERHGLVYSGDTYFGFFSADALADQVGLRNAKTYSPAVTPELPVEQMNNVAPFADSTLTMLDYVDVFEPDGGTRGLGFVRGVKSIRSDEWFFQAHFYQDPVWPGSLGIEAFVQLMKWMAAKRWGARPTTQFSTTAVGTTHRWVYRGQVIPSCSRVEVQASITSIDDARHRLRADGFLSVDGRVIYEMLDYELEMVP